jgi:gamma-glutamyltranspeptidase/glutathione hydrolase
LPAGAADPPRLALGTRGAVAGPEAHASEVGLAVLREGGNAVDAAVAVAFALAVTHPEAGNVGGGGFMVVRMADGRLGAIDYRETAPRAAHRDMYLDARGEPTRESIVGPRAAGIPGTVAGLALAHARFGTLAWRRLVEPAVRLARDGHALDAYHAEEMEAARAKALAARLPASAAVFTRPGGGRWRAGALWKQPELAATLAAVAERGPEAFYRGPIAERMALEVKRAGGIWSRDDLASYRAVERTPIVFSYRGHDVVTMPPPSAGGVVLRMILAAAEHFDLARRPWRGVEAHHLYLEAARRAYADRNSLLGDPDFVVAMQTAKLLDPAYMRSRLADVDAHAATPSSRVTPGIAPVRQPPPREPMHTTHFSVVDEAGNAVANTYTLNTSFGSLFVVPGTGVLLNNEMDDFSVKPGTANVYGLVQSELNRIEPGKRMLSSMTPTILVKDGALRALVGSPGGPTITTTVAQIVRAVVDYDKTIDEAVAAPRLHHQWLPDAVVAEASIEPELERGLTALGHAVKKRPRIGHANCIEIDPATRGYRAVADVARGGGAAVAY